MRKRWIMVLVAGVLILGVTGGAVLARGEGNGPDGKSAFGEFTSKVAAILQVDEADVEDAFEQAAKEMKSEALQQRLQDRVEDGSITQEQADAFLAWVNSRPEGIVAGLGLREFGERGGHHRRGHLKDMDGEALQQKLQDRVEDGSITQEQADAFLERYNSRPEGSFGRPGFHGFGKRGMHHRWANKFEGGAAGDEDSADEHSTDEGSGDKNSGEEHSTDEDSGDDNSGDEDSGDEN